MRHWLFNMLSGDEKCTDRMQSIKLRRYKNWVAKYSDLANIELDLNIDFVSTFCCLRWQNEKWCDVVLNAVLPIDNEWHAI